MDTIVHRFWKSADFDQKKWATDDPYARNGTKMDDTGSRESNRNVILSLKSEAWKPIYFIRRDNIYYRVLSLSATWHVNDEDRYHLWYHHFYRYRNSKIIIYKKKTISDNCIPFTSMAVSIFYTIFLRSMRKSRSIHPVIDYYNEYRYCNDYTIYSSRTKPHDFANHRPRISTYIYYIRI